MIFRGREFCGYIKVCKSFTCGVGEFIVISFRGFFGVFCFFVRGFVGVILNSVVNE